MPTLCSVWRWDLRWSLGSIFREVRPGPLGSIGSNGPTRRVGFVFPGLDGVVLGDWVMILEWGGGVFR